MISIAVHKKVTVIVIATTNEARSEVEQNKVAGGYLGKQVKKNQGHNTAIPDKASDLEHQAKTGINRLEPLSPLIKVLSKSVLSSLLLSLLGVGNGRALARFDRI